MIQDKFYGLTAGSIRTIRQTVEYVNELRRKPERRRSIDIPASSVGFRAVVIGIDLATWGGGRKRLAVQKIRSLPFNYGGAVLYVDGGYDSMIDCGQEVLCLQVSKVQGDTASVAYMAIPIIAVDQHYLVEVDPAYIAVVASATLPTIANPCPVQNP